MGGSYDSGIGFGRNAQEAFRYASEQAGYEHGHGYSGSLAEKHDFVIFELPKRMTLKKLDKLCARMENGKKLLKDDQKHERLIRRILNVDDDKWGPATCLPLQGKELKDAKERAGLKGTQKKAYRFQGMCSS